MEEIKRNSEKKKEDSHLVSRRFCSVPAGLSNFLRSSPHVLLRKFICVCQGAVVVLRGDSFNFKVSFSFFFGGLLARGIFPLDLYESAVDRTRFDWPLLLNDRYLED